MQHPEPTTTRSDAPGSDREYRGWLRQALESKTYGAESKMIHPKMSALDLALKELFEDTSVPLDVTHDALDKINEDVEEYMRVIEEDLA